MYQVYRQTMGNKPLLFGGGSPDTSGSEDLSGVQFINGTRPGNPQLVELAKRQVGNVGGYPYWSWYGFDSRVEWCACFVSWCYNQDGKNPNRALQAVSPRAFRGSSLMDSGAHEAMTTWLPAMPFSLTGIWMGPQTMWVSSSAQTAAVFIPWREIPAMPARSKVMT